MTLSSLISRLEEGSELASASVRPEPSKIDDLIRRLKFEAKHWSSSTFEDVQAGAKLMADAASFIASQIRPVERKPYDMIVKRLLNPPFGTETSERLLMGTAADAIRTLLDKVADQAPAAEPVAWAFGFIDGEGKPRHGLSFTRPTDTEGYDAQPLYAGLFPSSALEDSKAARADASPKDRP